MISLLDLLIGSKQMEIRRRSNSKLSGRRQEISNTFGHEITFFVKKEIERQRAKDVEKDTGT